MGAYVRGSLLIYLLKTAGPLCIRSRPVSVGDAKIRQFEKLGILGVNGGVFSSSEEGRGGAVAGAINGRGLAAR